MGGDGTVNEVANGLIADDRPLRADLTLGIIPHGTGGDFVRTLGIPATWKAPPSAWRGEGAGGRRGQGPLPRPGRKRGRSYFLNEGEIGMGAAAATG